MSNLFSNTKNICTSILLLCIIFNYISLSEIKENFTLEKINAPYTKAITFKNNDEGNCISYSIVLEEEVENLENLYIHFSTDSENNKQILYYSSIGCPTASDAEKYNYKYSDLFINFPDSKGFYLTVKCKSYPCSFSLNTIIEKDYANLNLTKSDTYSYFVSAEDKISNMIFKIPSSMDKNYSDVENHMLTISVTNPSDLDYNQLYLVEKGEKIPLNNNISYFKTSMDIIFTFIEEDFIKGDLEDKFYALEINSIEDQFVSITVTNSRFNRSFDGKKTDIIPNTTAKYSYLFVDRYKLKYYNQECFTFNESYLKKYLKDNDLLYVSIEYFTYPIRPYFKYNDDFRVKEYNFEKSQNSVNIIIEKNSDKYPSICFNSIINEAAFNLQVFHIPKDNNNIDIYDPLTSGFFHTKTLNKNNLALFTHVSDIHYINKLSFYLKVLKGNPEMYIVQCNEYPNCYNKIDELKKNAIKPDKKYNIYRYTYSYKEIKKDLSPYGTNQSLLYVYCPETSSRDDYCQFQTIIYSNFDEISLLANDTFYSYLLENGTELYKIHLQKRSESINRIQIFLNATEGIEFEYFAEDLKNFEIKNKTKDNLLILEYIPYANFSLDLKDYDITFNVKAKKNIFYYIKYETVLIINLEIEKIKGIDEINYLPIKMYSELPFTKNNSEYNFKDLLFNFQFQTIDRTIPEKTNSFETIEIKATIINKDQLNNISSTGIDENIFDTNISTLFDLSTRTAVLNIEK